MKKMKHYRLLSLLSAAFLSTTLFAQSLEVKEAFLAGTDISGSKYARTAPDGKSCALVKVRLPLQGVAFEGPVVGDVEERSGEYWVFLPADSQRLCVRHQTFGETVLDFEALCLAPLLAKATYVVVIHSQGGHKAKHPFTLQVTPASAMVIIDAEPVTLEKGLLSASMEEGSHEYVATAEGYEMQAGTFVVAASGENRLAIELPVAKALSLTPEEQYQLGYDYAYGSNSRQRDIPKAISYLEPAAESGHIAAQFLLASLYKQGAAGKPDYGKSFALFQKAADGGIDEALIYVAEHYLNGWGTEKDEKKAIDMFTQQGKKGNEWAMLKLANCYLKGKGVKKSVKKGVAWLEKAAAKNNVMALYELGDGFITGRFGKIDARKATEYLVRGVELNDVACMTRLAKIFYYGEGGVREDTDKAFSLVKMIKAYQKEKK